MERNGEIRDGWVLLGDSHNAEVARLLRLTRHVAVFESCAPPSTLRMSQVLARFEILVQSQGIYSGRAVVRNLIDAGTTVVCEVSLHDEWLGTIPRREDPPNAEAGFEQFLRGWHRIYRVLPEFKVAVADLHAFLHDLRLWLEQQEPQAVSQAPGYPFEANSARSLEVQNTVLAAINRLHERFEEVGDTIPEDRRPAHEHFARRHLHPLFLCSPFGRRAYMKPLGYAGDYEMINMILRSPYEGASLFARTMNLWLLRQYPSEAHRNRIDHLASMLASEALRRRAEAKPCRVLSLGCGPAHELQRFLRESSLADCLCVDLVDLNEETLGHVGSVLAGLKGRYGRRTDVTTRKQSVFGLMKAAKGSSGRMSTEQDFIYCAGLFDYLTDSACRQLLKVCWDGLRPGGVVLATNVASSRPFRHMLEFLLDWRLNYRSREQMLKLVPEGIPAEAVRVMSDPTGVNLYLELRRSAPG